MKIIKAEQLKSDLDSGKDMILINALTKNHFADCHIIKSINICFESDFVHETAGWKKDQYIVVHCGSIICGASKAAVTKLEALGFTNVYLYEDGLKDWLKKGYPTEGACQGFYLKS